jgi:hypothetical protein
MRKCLKVEWSGFQALFEIQTKKLDFRMVKLVYTIFNKEYVSLHFKWSGFPMVQPFENRTPKSLVFTCFHYSYVRH